MLLRFCCSTSIWTFPSACLDIAVADGIVFAVTSQAQFPDRLAALMVDKRLSISALSMKAQVPERTIARYRAGTSEPRDRFGDPTPYAYALAEALGVTVEGLLLDTRPEALAS